MTSHTQPGNPGGASPAAPLPPRVTTIPALAPAAQKRLRAAAYCRVSTLLDSQEGSFEAQRRHFQSAIESAPDWELAGLYLEAGASGVGTEARPELRRLLADCEAGKIDLILTKSISRFARNTADCLALVRKLSALGVEIRFEKERLSTGSMGSELLLTVLACLAENESRALSDNLKWGLRKRFRAGSYQASRAPYAYRREKSGFLVVSEQAEIVRGIFQAAASGSGCRAIAAELNARGVPGPRGGRWSDNGVRYLLRNPAYVGDMLYQKTFTDERFRQRPNRGQLDRYYVRGHHEAIVSREVFTLAGRSLRQRGGRARREA